MAHIRFEPARDFEHIINRVGDILGEVGKGISVEVGNFVPRTDISEDEQTVFVQMELPGLSKEDVKITFNEEGALTIFGEKKKVSDATQRKYMRVERGFGKFSRTITIPVQVSEQNIKAEFVNGVLSIALSKIEPPKPKEYNVNID